jgi:hypothetical protein
MNVQDHAPARPAWRFNGAPVWSGGRDHWRIERANTARRGARTGRRNGHPRRSSRAGAARGTGRGVRGNRRRAARTPAAATRRSARVRPGAVGSQSGRPRAARRSTRIAGSQGVAPVREPGGGPVSSDRAVRTPRGSRTISRSPADSTLRRAREPTTNTSALARWTHQLRGGTIPPCSNREPGRERSPPKARCVRSLVSYGPSGCRRALIIPSVAVRVNALRKSAHGVPANNSCAGPPVAR